MSWDEESLLERVLKIVALPQNPYEKMEEDEDEDSEVS
jgi:hypothetical protein